MYGATALFRQPEIAGMIGSSAALQRVRLSLAKVASSNCTVLITGETGTGKELAAEFIHRNSSRQNRPFACINCAAIPDTLLESELFGHSRGAFTGAEEHREGLLASANGGTVFLDEIGDMSLLAQAKLLRVIEKKEVCHIGGTRSRQLDLRFLAATNQDLAVMASRGSFRKDLFFRLNVAHINLPPLRERREDIPLLLDHYCRDFNRAPGARLGEFSEECMLLLVHYDWPGNVRELKNLVESLSIGGMPAQVGKEHLPAHLHRREEEGWSDEGRNAAHARSHQHERDSLISALASAKGNKSAAAKRLHWSRMTLYRKMAKHNLRPQRAG
jgi:two-component system response regulator HydG/two-component system response regulator AtoC